MEFPFAHLNIIIKLIMFHIKIATKGFNGQYGIGMRVLEEAFGNHKKINLEGFIKKHSNLTAMKSANRERYFKWLEK